MFTAGPLFCHRCVFLPRAEHAEREMQEELDAAAVEAVKAKILGMMKLRHIGPAKQVLYRDPGLPKLRMVMEPKDYTFWRWLNIPIIT